MGPHGSSRGDRHDLPRTRGPDRRVHRRVPDRGRGHVRRADAHPAGVRRGDGGRRAADRGRCASRDAVRGGRRGGGCRRSGRGGRLRGGRAAHGPDRGRAHPNGLHQDLAPAHGVPLLRPIDRGWGRDHRRGLDGGGGGRRSPAGGAADDPEAGEHGADRDRHVRIPPARDPDRPRPARPGAGLALQPDLRRFDLDRRVRRGGGHRRRDRPERSVRRTDPRKPLRGRRGEAKDRRSVHSASSWLRSSSASSSPPPSCSGP